MWLKDRDSHGFGDVCLTVPMYDSVACSAEELTLSCPNDGDVLHILDAFYGRKDLRTCTDTPVTSMNASCVSRLAKAAVTTLCNGKKTCLISVTDELLAQECSGDMKYLEVAYSCTSKCFLF